MEGIYFLCKSIIIYAIGAIISCWILDQLVGKDLENRTLTVGLMAICWIFLIPLGLLLSFREYICRKLKRGKKRCFGRNKKK